MPKGLAVFLAFVIGAVCGYAVAMLAYIVATSVGGVADREGAMAMGVAFFFAPIAALIAGIAFAAWAARKFRAAGP